MRDKCEIQKEIDALYNSQDIAQQKYRDEVSRLYSQMEQLRKELEEASKPKFIPAVRFATWRNEGPRIIVRVDDHVYVYKLVNGNFTQSNEWPIRDENLESKYYTDVETIVKGNFKE